MENNLTTDNKFYLTYEHMRDLLTVEESTPAVNREAIAAATARRTQIEADWATLNGETARLWRRYQNLPQLPDDRLMDWAGAVLAFPNLRIVVIDTTGVEENADIIRLTVMDRHGNFTFDHLVTPERRDFEAANTRYTGIEPIDLEMHSRPLAALWHNFTEAVQGHYTLAYNLPFIQDHLNESAKHYGLPPIRLIGDDLQKQATSFFRPDRYYPSKLVDVAARIGCALPTPATTVERAQAQLMVLHAMAEGVTGVAKSAIVALSESPDEEDDSEGPF